jgi:hypothetical protein
LSFLVLVNELARGVFNLTIAAEVLGCGCEGAEGLRNCAIPAEVLGCG